MSHIRKHHSIINEEEEIYEIVENGLVVWFGCKDELTEWLGTPDWACGQIEDSRRAAELEEVEC